MNEPLYDEIMRITQPLREHPRWDEKVDQQVEYWKKAYSKRSKEYGEVKLYRDAEHYLIDGIVDQILFAVFSHTQQPPYANSDTKEAISGLIRTLREWSKIASERNKSLSDLPQFIDRLEEQHNERLHTP